MGEGGSGQADRVNSKRGIDGVQVNGTKQCVNFKADNAGGFEILGIRSKITTPTVKSVFITTSQ